MNLSSNLLKNPRGGSLTPRAEKTQNDKKFSKSLKIFLKISINLRVFVWITKTYSS